MMAFIKVIKNINKIKKISGVNFNLWKTILVKGLFLINIKINIIAIDIQNIRMLDLFNIFNWLKISVDKNIKKKKIIDENIINFRKHI